MGQRAQPPSCVRNVTGDGPSIRRKEGGVDVKSAWSLCPGRHTCYNGKDSEFIATPQGGANLQTFPQWGLRSATRPHERGIGSNRGSAMPR